MSKQNETAQQIKINPKEIPQEVYDVGCSVLNTSVRQFLNSPDGKKAYEKWLESEEAKRFFEREQGGD